MLNPAIRAAGIELKMTEAEKADAILHFNFTVSDFFFKGNCFEELLINWIRYRTSIRPRERNT